MERSIQSVASMAKQADEVTRRAARDAEEGGATIQRSIHGISRMRDSMAQSATVIREMGKRTGDITTIVDTINLIAERTNLLSLNASIEAARAGDAGRGFAVVAEEIRNLADRSARATSDIAAIIKALQEVSQEAIAASNDGLRVADESNATAETGAASLKKILGGVSDAASLVSQISGATEEQRTAGQSVVAAIGAVNEQSRLIATATGEQVTGTANIVQATGEMRKIAQEVSKAVGEQGRAARDILKSAQATTRLAGQVRKASVEQARSAAEIAQATEAMRRGAATTARALAEQAVGSEQIVKAADSMQRTVTAVNRTVIEQATATDQITRASESMRQQAEQAAKALKEQSTAMREMAAATANTTKQIKLISGANRAHVQTSQALLEGLAEVREVTDRNARGVQQTRTNTADLLRQAEALNAMVERDAAGSSRSNGRSGGANGH
jgi:methyl-accepting chemotaxis protein